MESSTLVTENQIKRLGLVLRSPARYSRRCVDEVSFVGSRGVKIRRTLAVRLPSFKDVEQSLVVDALRRNDQPVLRSIFQHLKRDDDWETRLAQSSTLEQWASEMTLAGDDADAARTSIDVNQLAEELSKALGRGSRSSHSNLSIFSIGVFLRYRLPDMTVEDEHGRRLPLLTRTEHAEVMGTWIIALLFQELPTDDEDPKQLEKIVVLQRMLGRYCAGHGNAEEFEVARKAAMSKFATINPSYLHETYESSRRNLENTLISLESNTQYLCWLDSEDKHALTVRCEYSFDYEHWRNDELSSRLTPASVMEMIGIVPTMFVTPLSMANHVQSYYHILDLPQDATDAESFLLETREKEHPEVQRRLGGLRSPRINGNEFRDIANSTNIMCAYPTVGIRGDDGEVLTDLAESPQNAQEAEIFEQSHGHDFRSRRVIRATAFRNERYESKRIIVLILINAVLSTLILKHDAEIQETQFALSTTVVAVATLFMTYLEVSKDHVVMGNARILVGAIWAYIGLSVMSLVAAPMNLKSILSDSTPISLSDTPTGVTSATSVAPPPNATFVDSVLTDELVLVLILALGSIIVAVFLFNQRQFRKYLVEPFVTLKPRYDGEWCDIPHHEQYLRRYTTYAVCYLFVACGFAIWIALSVVGWL